MAVETTQFARVMREMGIQQIFALSAQAKGRVERMLETFQDRLVTELRLAGASTIDMASLFLQEFLPRYNAQFSVAAEQPETAYRPVPDELSLTETICLKDTLMVARDNTVKYQWRVLQLLPGPERPSYASLRGEILERVHGELMIRYQGEAVDFQEGQPPSSALWGADSDCSPGPELQEATDGLAHGHLDVAQRERLSASESAAKEAAEGRGAKGKPVRHQLHRTPTATQQARWEAVQEAREQGLSLRTIAKNLGMARDTVGKYLKAASPPIKQLSQISEAPLTALPDKGTCQLEQTKVIGWLLVVAHQYRPALGHPAQGAFHHLPPGRVGLLARLVQFLLTSSPDMRLVSGVGDGPVAGGIVIPLVQAQVLDAFPAAPPLCSPASA